MHDSIGLAVHRRMGQNLAKEHGEIVMQMPQWPRLGTKRQRTAAPRCNILNDNRAVFSRNTVLVCNSAGAAELRTAELAIPAVGQRKLQEQGYPFRGMGTLHAENKTRKHLRQDGSAFFSAGIVILNMGLRDFCPKVVNNGMIHRKRSAPGTGGEKKIGSPVGQQHSIFLK